MIKPLITLAVALLLTACNGMTTAKQMNAITNGNQVLPDRLTIGVNVHSIDNIKPEDYPILTTEQCTILAQESGLEFPDSVQFIGNRAIDKGCTLAAYKIPTGEDPNQFKVYLITLDGNGSVIDGIDLREFHTSEIQGTPRFGGNRIYTSDAEVLFDGPRHFTLHRVMTLSGLILKERRLTEIWRAEWDNHYEITDDGHIHFTDQHETYRTDGVDDPVIEEYQSCDRTP